MDVNGGLKGRRRIDSALYAAAAQGHTGVTVEQLVTAGADVNKARTR